MSLAPIIIFAYNRADELAWLLDSLTKNQECSSSDLYVFVDGPKGTKPEDVKKNAKVRHVVENISGFKSMNYSFSEQNKGLGPSIIHGVTEVINKHGKAIVLEDDLTVSENFLSFMNQGLHEYEGKKNVFSICGYSNTIKPPKDYPYDTYFCSRHNSTGWATWKDRWDMVDWNLENWNEVRKTRQAFNQWGGSDCWKLLNSWHKGENQSWAIRFCYTQFKNKSLSLFPLLSKVVIGGFNGEGTNCKTYSRFKCTFDRENIKSFSFPEKIEMNPHIYKSFKRYHGIPIRIWSKIMYLIHKK